MDKENQVGNSGRITSLIAVLGLALLIGVGSSAWCQEATAAVIYQPTGGQVEGEPSPGAPLALDDATGDIIAGTRFKVFIQEGLAIYAPEGSGAKLIGTFNEPDLGKVGSIAIDQASRSVYVGDISNGRIAKYAITGSGSLTFTPVAGFTSPAQGSEPGQIGSFGSSLAVDPSTGDLLVADSTNERVSRFAPDGSFISSFDGSDSSAGPFRGLRSIAVDATGNVYVVDAPGGVHGEKLLERYTSAGAADGAFDPPVEAPWAVAVEPEGENVLVGAFDPSSSTHSRIYVVRGTEVIQESDLPEATNNLILSSLAAGGNRLYVNLQPFKNSEGAGIYTYEGVLAPDVELAAPSDISAHTATISGTINPLGKPTSYHLRYTREGGSTQETVDTPVGEAANSKEPFSVELTDLVANSKYSVRLVASNEQATIVSAQVFETPVAPPVVVTGNAPNPTEGSAELTGTINPGGQQTTYYFEWGSTSAYGSRVPVGPEAPAGNGRDQLRVAQRIFGLEPGATYHYRLVARNATGSSAGSDRTFTTEPTADDHRAYELITPNEKGNSDAYRFFLHATPSGNAVTYEMVNVIPGTRAFPKFPRYTSTRAADGWQTTSLEPVVVPTGSREVRFQDVFAVSEDETRAVVASSAVLAPGGKLGGSNLYMLDIASGTYETILGLADPTAINNWTALQAQGPRVVIGGTPSFSRVYLENGSLGPFELVPGTTDTSLFEWTSSGGLKVVAENTAYGTSSIELSEQRFVSTDGSVVFYRSGQDYSLHAIDNGQDIQISQPFATFVGASADGRFVFYLDEGSHLSRYDLISGNRTLISETAAEDGWGVSEDGSTVYFRAQGPGGEPDILVWRDGDVHVVAPDSFGTFRRAASPDGRFMAFISRAPLTGYDNEGVEELYRYDADTRELACASCRTDGGKPLGPVLAGEVQQVFEFYLPRIVLDNGEVFFDSPDPLVASDVNSNRDVYSFNGRTQTLLSSGTGSSDSYFGDASRSGKDVFFTSRDRLVKADTNFDADVYDARVGGGIQSQNVEPLGPDCTGAGCVTGTGADPAPPAAGSEAPAVSHPRKHKHKKSLRKKQKCRRATGRNKHVGKKKCGRSKQHRQAHDGRNRDQRRQGR